MSADPPTYYLASAAPVPSRPRLSGDLTADVCIIGGGFTGLSAALHLAQAGAKTVLLEAERVSFAASGRNGGQIHTGYRKTQAELEKWLGPIHARDLWSLAEEAKTLLHGLIAQHEIECALRPGLIIAAHKPRAVKPLADDTEYLVRKYDYGAARMMGAAETEAATGSKAYPAARFDAGGGHLHPLDFARGLARAAAAAGTLIFENSRALAVENETVICESGKVRAGMVLLACDAFTGAVAPQLAKYIAHVESYITATEPLPDNLYRSVLASDAAVADTRHVLDYYRKSADRRVLYAGRETYWNPPADIAALVRPRMLAVYPQLRDVKIEYAWRGTVGITVTRMPHLGRLSERVLFAHGYSGQGVALAPMGGKLMAEAALGKRERFDVMARVPPKAFPGGALLRKPMVSAALYAFKIMDAL